jgi:hypothetical protein
MTTTHPMLNEVAKRQARSLSFDKLVGVALVLGTIFNLAVIETVARKGLERPVDTMIAQITTDLGPTGRPA